jgi:hypothetical protein
MSRQHPFESIVLELVHRSDLLVPRVPANLSQRVQALEWSAPPQMVAVKATAGRRRETMAAAVARCGDRHKAAVELDRLSVPAIYPSRVDAVADKRRQSETINQRQSGCRFETWKRIDCEKPFSDEGGDLTSVVSIWREHAAHGICRPRREVHTFR